MSFAGEAPSTMTCYRRRIKTKYIPKTTQCYGDGDVGDGGVRGKEVCQQPIP